MSSITSANAIIMLTVAGLFDAPQQIQGFAADDVFSTDAVVPGETMMGVDGRLSGGHVNNPVMQSYALQADSPSVDFFDAWFNAQKALGDTYVANGVITLPSLGTKWSMTRGFLTNYPFMPDAKKLLQPRRFQITWERVDPART